MRWTMNFGANRASLAPVEARLDAIDRMWRVVCLVAFAVAVIAFLAAPLLAVQWSRQPFTGFLVEQTLVVEPIGGQNWSGYQAGIDYPQRIMRIGGQAVNDAAEYEAIVESHHSGDRLTVFTRTPDGREQLYPNILLTEFPSSDLWRLFWLPYIVGVVYLAIGAWIYRLRGRTRPGRALAIFCIVTALTCGMFFDAFSSHAMPYIWVFAIAQIGGVLIGMAWRFPEEWAPVTRRSWITILPFVLSIGIAAWAIVTLRDTADPWAYLPARSASFRYAAVGIFIFLAVIIYRARKGSTPIVRRQARLVLIGSVIAFSPVMLWLVIPLLGVTTISFDPAVFLPPLLVFPIAVALAILRYRLWEVDNIVNQAFVFGLLTAILAGVFAALSAFTQRLFLAVTGEQSDIAIVITTLLVAAAFTPVKSWVESLVSYQFRDARDHMRELRSYGDQVRAFVQMSDVNLITRRLLEEAVESFKAQSGALSLLHDGKLEVVHTVGPWRNDARLSVGLNCGHHRHGLLLLGPPLPNQSYDRLEAEALQRVADEVARAVCLAEGRGSSALQANGVKGGAS